jgi:hypothetical protein
VGAGLFGPVGAAVLAGLEAGWDGPSGDGGDPVLVGLASAWLLVTLAGVTVMTGAAWKATGFALVLADGAVAAGPTLAFQLPFPSPGHARPGTGQAEADPGLGDDLDQAGAAAGLMLGHPVVQVLGPVLDLPTVPGSCLGQSGLGCPWSARLSASLGSPVTITDETSRFAKGCQPT